MHHQTVDARDIKQIAKILRENGYSYEQSRYLKSDRAQAAEEKER